MSRRSHARTRTRAGRGQSRRTGAVGVRTLLRDDRRNGVFENQLLLIVRLKYQRVLVEALDPPG